MLAAGTQLGKYKIQSLLGSGGMADVYLAVDVRIKRQVAVKVLPPEFARNADHAARFKREVMASAALDHPGIVSIFDVGQSDYKSLRYQYYVMNLLPRGDLKQRIEKKLSIPQIFKIAREVGAALEYAHKAGFVHRDIKPENILFDREDRAVLTDLGIARAMRSDNRMTDTGMSVGTPSYMSPEQAKGKYDLDGRADLYSLGVVLYEMLTGNAPYQADTTIGLALQHVNDPIPTLPKRISQFQPIIDKLMAKEAEDRYDTARDFLKELTLLEKNGKLKQGNNRRTGATTSLKAEQQLASQKRKNRRFRWILMTLVVGVALLIQFRPLLFNEGLEGTLPDERKVGDSVLPPVDLLEQKAQKAREQRQKELDDKVKGLLTEAENDVIALRLTRPVGNNAHLKYLEVLKLEPENQDALDGLENICDQYLIFADKALVKGDRAGARRYLETAQAILPTSEKVAARMASLNQMFKANPEPRPLQSAANLPEPKVQPEKQPPPRQPQEVIVEKTPEPAVVERPQAKVGTEFQDRMQVGGVSPVMVIIPSGSFVMGNQFVDGDDDEKPIRRVTFSNAFAVSKFEITVAEYARYAQANNLELPDDEGWGSGNHPVINVSWYDAVAYTEWMSRQTGFRYRLLSEAEWEYSANAEQNRIFPWGDQPSHLQANYNTEFCCDAEDPKTVQWPGTSPVGSYPSNAFAVHDMAGNVWEWVLDCKMRYQASESQGQAMDKPNCDERVVRGGSWGSKPEALRVSNRAGRAPNNPGKYNGFRIMRELD
ncbi:MAG: bifunctional serine/threonine-protein kinase/formylglycine-generating enzyme family protein [Pseudomonadota bacterium]